MSKANFHQSYTFSMIFGCSGEADRPSDPSNNVCRWPRVCLFGPGFSISCGWTVQVMTENSLVSHIMEVEMEIPGTLRETNILGTGGCVSNQKNPVLRFQVPYFYLATFAN